MAETKWTPGPWSMRPVPCEDAGCAEKCGPRYPNFAISGAPWDEFATVYGRAHDRKGQREGRANARLIAAAPDLFRELHHLVSLLAAKGEQSLDVPGLATLNGARAALAKARGE